MAKTSDLNDGDGETLVILIVFNLTKFWGCKFDFVEGKRKTMVY